MGRNQSKLEQLSSDVRHSSLEIEIIKTDLSNFSEIPNIINNLDKKYGYLDYMFLNHGCHHRGNIKNLAWEEILKMLQLNLVAIVSLIKHAIPLLLKAREFRLNQQAIIAMGSMSSKLAMKNNSGYCASKHGVIGFMNAIFEDLREDGIKTSTICPGYINSRAHSHLDMEQDKMIQVKDIIDTLDYILKCEMSCCPTEVIIRPQFSPYRK